MPKTIEGKTAIEAFFRDRADQQVATRLSERDDALVVEKRAAGTLFSIGDSVKMPDADELKALCEAAGIKFVPKSEHIDCPVEDTMSRTKLLWASDERVDRDGDIVRQDWKFENFDKNPLVLFGHEWHMPPIGAVLQREIVQRNDADFEGQALRLLETFADASVWEWADTVFRLLDGGFMRSGSVGFFPGRIVVPEDDKERSEMGLGRWGAVLEHNELIEHSIVSVPANPGAHEVLSGMKAKGLLKVPDLQVIRELKRRELALDMADPVLWKRVDSGICQLWKHLFPRIEIDRHRGIEDPIDPHGVKEIGCCVGGASLRVADKVWLEEDYEAAEPVTRDRVTKPFVGEHACRLREPDEFEDGSFRRVSQTTEEGKRIDVIIGQLVGEEDTTAQSLRYPIEDWTEAEARTSCEENEGILFEPALPEPDADPDENSADLDPAAIAVDLEQMHTRMTEFGTQLGEIRQSLTDLVERLEEGDRLATIEAAEAAVEPALAEILAIDPKALDKAVEAAQTL